MLTLLFSFVLLAATCSHAVGVKNQAVIVSSYPKNELSAENFQIVDTDIPSEEELQDEEVILKVYGLSVDPYMRGRMRDGGLPNYFVGAFSIGETPNGGGFAKVVASKNSEYHVGDFVAGGAIPWKRFFRAKPAALGLSKAPKSESTDFYYKFLFPFNIAPLSAWLPIRQFWPKESIHAGEVAYVSGAAGAVGMIAGQILKNIYGLRVIGSAGSDEKVDYLKEKLGFDEAFNYKSESPDVALPRLAPNKINYFFDNVGGETLDAALVNMASNGKVIACGAIQQYDKEDTSVNMKNLFQIIVLQLTIQGYLVFQFAEYFGIGNQELIGWANEGKLITHETYIDGLENVPEAFVGLLNGKNIGKMMVRVVTDDVKHPEL